MNLQKLATALTAGIGSTLGSVVLVLGFGCYAGSLLTETGATQKISEQLIYFLVRKGLTCRASYSLCCRYCPVL
jgi:H+/gluconate symporter-like permease